MNELVLHCSNVSKKIGNKVILENVSFDIYSGDIFGFIGPNGSGKTTMIKLILSLQKLDSGLVTINNYDILMAHNISLFTYRIDYSFNYKDTEINLVISKSNNKLRYLILSLSLVSILFLSASRYLSFFRENKVLKDNSTPFYKSKYCLILFFEVIYLLVFQYPYLNYIWINHQLDRLMILPLSSLLSAFANFRALYFFQLINSLSIYDSVLSEKILDKFYLSTNLFFTMKAYQKSNPFI